MNHVSNPFKNIPVYGVYVTCRPETPPNTPQRARAAARQLERDNRILDSPQRHRTPVPPLLFNNAPLPLPLPNIIIPDDPFGPAPQVPVHFNGQQYQNLPGDLALRLQNLPALPPPPLPRGRRPARGGGHGHDHVPPVSLPLCFSSYILNTFVSLPSIIIWVRI